MVVLPANSNFSMQINSFLKASIQQKNMELEHRNYIHEKLMEILLRGENPGDLARILSELLRRPVLLLDQHLDLMAAQPAAAETLPLPECDAMTQGYIGYHIQNVLGEELKTRGIDRKPATVVTQVLVNEEDPAFRNPTKPIGSFYTREESRLLEREGYVFREDAGRGYRRMVPSPKPRDIIEKDVILHLIESGCQVIACGGGGIPVVSRNGRLQGVPTVIDKDYASAVLAKLIHADALFLLTAVDQASINWGTPEQKPLDRVDVSTMEDYIEQEQFAPGIMLPKVEASIDFVRDDPGRKAIITSISNLRAALRGETGTEIRSRFPQPS